MTNISKGWTPTRRSILKYGAGISAASILPTTRVSSATAIKKRAIPKSGEMLPIVGIGTSRVFDIGNDQAEWRERQGVLQNLFDGGGTVIDTAPSYQDAEEVIGKLLTRMKARERAFIATKVWADGLEEGREQIENSFKLLKTDKIDLFQVHNLSDTDTQLDTLSGLKKEGRIRYVGITHYLAGYNQELAAAMRKHNPDFVQLGYSLNQISTETDLLPIAKDLGIAVIVNRPYGRGSMFRQVRGRKLPNWAKEFDAKSWGQFFLKYILGHPTVTCVIPGTDKVKYMLDNLEAGRGRMPDPEMRKRMLSYWQDI
ncbi:MAG: aldo/keto reductase [Rhodospirillaceae bacterium]|nr:aldo/keto reductase [Rhodospirillaceae bacterium]|tara:strand:+ start:2020 stop:2958 length:939 start_codon:yes stop_codon:yes gene_type:complete